MPINGFLLWGTGLQGLKALPYFLKLSFCVFFTFSGIQISISCCTCAQQLEAFLRGVTSTKGKEFGLVYCPQTEKQETTQRNAIKATSTL